jgi:hypothetical protein
VTTIGGEGLEAYSQWKAIFAKGFTIIRLVIQAYVTAYIVDFVERPNQLNSIANI